MNGESRYTKKDNDELLSIFREPASQDEHNIVDPGINSYVTSEDFDVLRRPQLHLTLPSQRRHNRALLGMVDPFIPLKSFIYRGGIREILLQRK